MMSRLWAIAALIFTGFALNAQEIDIKLSSTYAIQNAHIVQKPGQTIDKGTIVIKDGVITDVGQNVKVPADAIIIDADSMYIYPGFIDAYNNTGVKKSEEKKDQERVKNPGYPPNDRAGIMPDRNLSDVFDGGDKSVSSWREAGFTASMSAPEGGMLPGKTSIILHSGKDASQSIVSENFGVLGTFESANRMYPATILGVMAKYRDLFRQTGYAAKHTTAYNANPVGMARPAYDKSIKALMPVADKSQMLYMEAEKMKDISRAMTLQKDLGFNMAFINVKQGGQYIDDIKKQNIPVVLSMEVPESEDKKKGKDKEKSDTDEDEGEKKDEEKKEEVEKDKDPEMEAMKARRDEAIAEYQSQAAAFAKAGIAFGLSGKDIKGKDVKKNAKLMMDMGVTEDQMLAALTTNPAKMYGVSNIMGSLEKGKLGNLIVSNGPFFDEDSKIKYVFVEGHQFEYEIKEKKAKVEGKKGDLSGIYDCVLEVPGDERDMRIIISGSVDNYEVSVENEGESTEVDKVEVDGNKVNFPLEVDYQGYKLDLTYNLVVKDGEVSGTVVAGNFGSFPIKGERIGDPK
jgi:hypothetical protein